VQVNMVLALSFIPLLDVAAIQKLSENSPPEFELIIDYREYNYTWRLWRNRKGNPRFPTLIWTV